MSGLKMTPHHVAVLTEAVQVVKQRNPDVSEKTYASNGLSAKRYRWDLLWACRIDGLPISRWVSSELYSYLNDEHIDSALRQIVKGLQ